MPPDDEMTRQPSHASETDVIGNDAEADMLRIGNADVADAAALSEPSPLLGASGDADFDDSDDSDDETDSYADAETLPGAADSDDETALLLDIAPRERGRTTAVPLNLRRRRSAPPVQSPDARAPADDWDDDEQDDYRTRVLKPVAAPTTARMPAIDLAPAPHAAVMAPVEVAPAAPLVIPGAKRLKRMPKNPFIQRRTRPLAFGMATGIIITALVASVLLVTTPLGTSLAAKVGVPVNAQIGSNSAVDGVRFQWYVAQWGDTPDSVAQKFHVALGGIFELNNLQQGAELQVGFSYKIPLDATYGANYTPPQMLSVSANYGTKRYGPNWWNSIAGSPPANSPCAPNGGANLLGYDLQPPNWGARWVRGFIVYGTWVYHTGVDLAAPQGNVIHAAQAGQVIWAGYDATNGLGWSVKIDHCNHVSTVYGHMLRILVHVGDIVDVNQPVGLEGSTGNSTGPHLHYMVEWNNLWVDPMKFYASQSAIIGPPPGL